ncbi:MAG: ABC transporter permease [Defluviitaleaceae bacterium]|nr:ABC transporter permease [Defluviitaleaceae bacterium]MCL2276148.1 ABC transporter permease [Defluviitaleaceae bacterium]
MWKIVVRRLLILIPQLIALSLIVFFLAWLMPGDALRGLLDPSMPPGEMNRMREEAGLNDPWFVQYTRWVGNVLQGDLGRSLQHRVPVTRVIGDNMMNTVRLSIMTTVMLYAIALPLGLLAGRKHNKIPDKVIMLYVFTFFSIPTIVLALLMIFFFAFGLGWFPAMNAVDVRAAFEGGWPEFWSRIHHLILPSMTGAILGGTGIIYFLRNQVIDVQNSDYITTARAKGTPERRVYTHHVLRNALLPIAGGMGASIAAVVAGSLFIERTFTINGMGQLFFDSVLGRDWPVANALIMFYAVVGVVAGLLADITIMLVDPRIRIK